MHAMTLALQKALAEAGDPVKAPQMQAYAKTQQPFYGVSAPVRKALFKEARKQFPIKDFNVYCEVITQLWEGPTREEMYMGLEVACGYKAFHTDHAFPFYEGLFPRASNWDTLDWIASGLISPLVLKNPEREKDLCRWRLDENMWIRRASLLAHLRHGKNTNVDLLAETIVLLMHEKEFFIRKAIGWVLRQYARSNPHWVRAFVAQHEASLSGLSKREALKHLS